MKKLLLAAAGVLVLSGLAYAKEFEVKGKAGVYQVECKIDDLRIGANNIKIEIKDESGKNVTDAKVQVEYAMPEGIDLPPMNFKTDIKVEGDAYKGKIKIPMAGVWATVINVMRGEKTSSTDFYLEVH